MSKVIFQHVEKYFGKKCVLSEMNLLINDGEFVVLVGPSGCGKSTTLRMLAGLEEISKGDIYIDNRCVNKIPPKDRNIAMVFQDYALYPHFKVFDNMAFGLKVRKYDTKTISERVAWAAKLLNITDLLMKKPQELSGGQRQRVAIGRALVRKPDVFLFDEPLSNLDAKLRVQMRFEILKLHKEIKVTTIYVTHDQVEAMTMADRIVVMKDGLVQQIGSPRLLYTKPLNLFVASFIGSPPMNIFNPLIKISNSSGYASLNKDIQIKIDEADIKKLEKFNNKQITMGIRPEDIYDKELSLVAIDENEIKMNSDVVELIGKEKEVYLSRDDIKCLIITPQHSDIQSGEKVDVVFDMKKAHFFDNEGNRII